MGMKTDVHSTAHNPVDITLCATGCREWAAYKRWVTANIEASLQAWFGRVEVVRDGDSVFSPQSKYMFGYCPHGLFPIGESPRQQRSHALTFGLASECDSDVF